MIYPVTAGANSVQFVYNCHEVQVGHGKLGPGNALDDSVS